MESERKLLVKALVLHKEELQEKLHTDIKVFKDAEVSEKERVEGNRLYGKEKHDARVHAAIINHYNKSLAFAPNDSEKLALAYGNRSAFLLHINECEESIQDIDRACKITDSKVFEIKLLCRKIECLKKSGLPYEDVSEAAQALIDDISDKDAKKQDLKELLDSKIELSPKHCRAVNGEEKNSESNVLDSKIKQETCSFDDSVVLDYNDKYGRHVVAKRDFRPGETIFVKKLYAATLNVIKLYTYCNACLKICWSGIPCDNCNWAIFCSESCKTESWKKHHDVECAVYPNVMLHDDFILKYMHISLRLLISGIKEAGSISKLRTMLESVDKCKDPCLKNFSKDEKFRSSSFKILYTLKSDGILPPVLEVFSRSALIVLICLMRCSTIFGKDFELDNLEDLMENEDALFVGSLLIKLFGIKNNNAYNFSNIRHACEQLNDRETCEKNSCCVRGACLAPLISFFNHSCFPNASILFNEDCQAVVYALKPIKKDSQVFISYNCFFYKMSEEERQNRLRKYKFSCDCPACKENWAPLLNLPKNVIKPVIQQSSLLEVNLYKDCAQILVSVQSGVSAKIEQKDVKQLSESISKAIECVKQPSYVTCLLLDGLHEMFNILYSLKPESFGYCTAIKK